jgi:hypothetical protein
MGEVHTVTQPFRKVLLFKRAPTQPTTATPLPHIEPMTLAHENQTLAKALTEARELAADSEILPTMSPAKFEAASLDYLLKARRSGESINAASGRLQIERDSDYAQLLNGQRRAQDVVNMAKNLRATSGKEPLSKSFDPETVFQQSLAEVRKALRK